MNQTQEFDRLEQFVQKLLSQHEQLLDRNAHLQRLLQQRDNEIAELKEKVDSAASERGDISTRIKNLIDRIEEWQSTVADADEEVAETGDEGAEPLDESEAEPVAAADGNEAESGGGEEEILEEEERSESSREGGPHRNQQNLFHVGPSHEG